MNNQVHVPHRRSPVMAITGAASGIGRATAQLWAAHGGRLVLMDIAPEKLQTTVKEIGVDAARGIITDVTSRVSTDAAFSSIAEIEGRLDAVVASAGNASPTPTAEMSDHQWSSLMHVHLDGTMRTARAAYPLLKAHGGSIVVLSSVAGSHGMPQRASYNTVKHGVVGLMKSLAVEWAEDTIRVNAIAPGYTWTPFNQKLQEAGALDPSPITARVPMKRWAQPSEIAKPIVFLSGTDASYITGQTLYVDGGMTIGGDWYRSPIEP